MRSAEDTFKSLSQTLVEAGQALRISQAAQTKAEAESYRLQREVEKQAATIQRLREAGQEALVVIAALLNSVDWELSPTVIEALRGADAKLMAVLADASS